MEILNWFGRFHPAIVHLPIGILLIGFIFHWMSLRRPTWKVSAAVSPLYFAGFISSLVSAIAGLIMAREGGYDPDTIFWHKWLGILMVVISLYLWQRTKKDPTSTMAKWVGLALVAGLTYVGHLGGVMTHGPDFMVENAPNFVKKLASYDDRSHYPEYIDPDSTVIYRDIVSPYLEKKCWSCHSDFLTKGGLNMEHQDLFLEGGRNGEVIEGTAEGSELFKRVIMDPSSRKYMPPKGDALSYGEIKLLQWWLDAGAPMEKTVTEVEAPEEIKNILLRRHKLDTRPKSYIEKVKVEATPEEVMQKISTTGFRITHIAQNNNFLDVSWQNRDSADVNEQIESLAEVADRIAWLDLGSSAIDDESLSVVGNMANLVRLKLDNTDITDEGVKALGSLRHLESLNLYNSKITDSSAGELAKIPSLKRLFIWQTEFGEDGTATLQAALPDVEIVGGYNLSEATESQ